MITGRFDFESNKLRKQPGTGPSCISRIDAKVVLIDGETLAQLMIDHNVGVSTIGTYDIKKVDSDYFAEE